MKYYHFFLENWIQRDIESTRCWKQSLESLVHIDSCCRFVGWTSMMRISKPITCPRCSVGLWFEDCGWTWSIVQRLREKSKVIRPGNLFPIVSCKKGLFESLSPLTSGIFTPLSVMLISSFLSLMLSLNFRRLPWPSHLNALIPAVWCADYIFALTSSWTGFSGFLWTHHPKTDDIYHQCIIDGVLLM